MSFNFRSLLVLSLSFSLLQIFANSCKAQSVATYRVIHQPMNGNIEIFYDIPSNDDSILVKVFLHKKADANFNYQLKWVSGKVGIGVFEGKQLKIVWDIKKESPYIMAGKDFYYTVTAEKYNRSIHQSTFGSSTNHKIKHTEIEADGVFNVNFLTSGILREANKNIFCGTVEVSKSYLVATSQAKNTTPYLDSFSFKILSILKKEGVVKCDIKNEANVSISISSKGKEFLFYETTTSYIFKLVEPEYEFINKTMESNGVAYGEIEQTNPYNQVGKQLISFLPQEINLHKSTTLKFISSNHVYILDKSFNEFLFRPVAVADYQSTDFINTTSGLSDWAKE